MPFSALGPEAGFLTLAVFSLWDVSVSPRGFMHSKTMDKLSLKKKASTIKIKPIEKDLIFKSR